MAFRNVFTTGQAAKICRVSQQTIIRCFENGSLKGFRVPGSTFRRIPKAALHSFMRDQGLETAIVETNVILLAWSASALDDLHAEFVARLNGHPGKVVRVSDVMELGARALQLPPSIIVLDCRTQPVSDGCLRALVALKQERETMNLPLVIVALVRPALSSTERIQKSADLVMPVPLDHELIVQRCMELIG